MNIYTIVRKKTNTVVSNHFHSFKIVLFPSARSRDFNELTHKIFFFKFYHLTELLGFFDLSSISIYNEAKNNEFYNISTSNISCIA